MKWSAQLQGGALDLDLLRTMFATDELAVVREADDQYWITSTSFDGCVDASAVEQTAEALVEIMNGAARLREPHHQVVELAGCYKNDASDVTIARMSATLTGQGRLTADVSIKGVSGTDGVPAGPDWKALAERHLNIADAFRLLNSTALGFADLYKLYEVVLDDAGGPAALVGQGWATQADLKSFGASANLPNVSGDLARHARTKGSTGTPSRTMTLEESRSFIIALVGAWILWVDAGRPPSNAT